MLNFQREYWNPVKKHSKALVFFAVSKQIPIVYSADRGSGREYIFNKLNRYNCIGIQFRIYNLASS